MLFLFDFDLTIVTARATVPRQTRHALRRLVREGHAIGIVTNNALAPAMLGELGLPPCRCLVSRRGETRPELIARWFVAANASEAPFFYFDDISEQARAVAATFPGRCLGAVEVTDEQELYQLIETVRSDVK